MKQYMLTILAMSTWFVASAQDKAQYDLDPSELGKATELSTLDGHDGKSIRNRVAEITLIEGGYFTIGTSDGVATGALDDRCQITFGHPYALTSFPFIGFDGVWQRPDDFFSGATAPRASGDTLALTWEKSGACTFDFSLYFKNVNTIVLRMEVRNPDVISHAAGLGMMLDPALGRWGDGALILGANVIENDTLLQGVAVPSQFEVWERPSGSRGIGVAIDLGTDGPSHLTAANWHVLHTRLRSEWQSEKIRQLYDLTLRLHWEEITLSPNASHQVEIQLALLPPEFGTTAFMRWDMPSALTLANNLVFPQSLTTYLQLNNAGIIPVTNAELKFEAQLPLEATADEQPFGLAANDMLYPPVQMHVGEYYEGQAVPLAVQVVEQGNVRDQLARWVYLPAPPVSDTGLVVTIDSVITSSFPEVQLRFEARVKATSQLTTQLQPPHVFLFEVEQRLREFTLEKDRSGGVDEADVVFVLDVTGSMSNEINAVKNNILEFADSLSQRGIDIRLGMVTFLDVVENIYPFTSDVQAFRQIVAQQQAHGGGDLPENSLEALLEASKMTFRPAAKRVVIWLTDATYHEADEVTQLTRSQVVDALLANGITAHCIGPTEYKSSHFDAIILPTGGDFFDIGGNFRDILIAISRLRGSGRYLLTYSSPTTGNQARTVRLQLHYAGLGGEAVISYQPPGPSKAGQALHCFPNPFNPATRIRVLNPQQLAGEIHIYNLLGQRVRTLPLMPGHSRHEVLWEATDDRGSRLSSGLYFVQLGLFDAHGTLQIREVQRIVHVK